MFRNDDLAEVKGSTDADQVFQVASGLQQQVLWIIYEAALSL